MNEDGDLSSNAEVESLQPLCDRDDEGDVSGAGGASNSRDANGNMIIDVDGIPSSDAREPVDKDVEMTDAANTDQVTDATSNAEAGGAAQNGGTMPDAPAVPLLNGLPLPDCSLDERLSPQMPRRAGSDPSPTQSPKCLWDAVTDSLEASDGNRPANEPTPESRREQSEPGRDAASEQRGDCGQHLQCFKNVLDASEVY